MLKLRSLHPVLTPTPNSEHPFIISLFGITEDGIAAAYNPNLRKWDLVSMEVATLEDHRRAEEQEFARLKTEMAKDLEVAVKSAQVAKDFPEFNRH